MTGDARRRAAREVRGRVLAGVFVATLGAAVPVGVEEALAATPVTLVQASPGIGDAVGSAPATVTLTFDRTLTKGTISVAGPSGDAAGGSAAITGNRLSEPLAGGLPTGSYRVTWMAKARGATKNKGSYTFQVTGSTPSTSPTPSVTTPAPSSSATSGGGVFSTQGASPTTGPTPSASSPVAGAGDPHRPVAAGSGPTATIRAGAATTGTGPAAEPVAAGAGAPAADPTPGAVPLATPPPARPEEDGARKAVSAVVSGSRTLGPWLIVAAVALQLGAALWGLWRWRQGDTPDPTTSGVTSASRPSPGPPDPDEHPTVSVPGWADRPWTGELPVRRDERDPGAASGNRS